MMLEAPFPMLSCRVCWAVMALGASVLPGCGPGTAPEGVPASVATARALVRPHVTLNALSTPGGGDAPQGAASAGPTTVLLAHRNSDGALRVGCVDSEDGAEALVRDSEEAR